jgi:hypothetical protein
LKVSFSKVDFCFDFEPGCAIPDKATHQNGDVLADGAGHLLELGVVGHKVFDVAEALDVLKRMQLTDGQGDRLGEFKLFGRFLATKRPK